KSLASWTAGQKLPPSEIELVVAAGRTSKESWDEIRQVLGDRDRLIPVDSENEMELYDAAARSARGEWLLFTEPHVVAAPDCLTELLGHARASGLDGCCVQTRPRVERHWVAAAEQRMYLDDAAVWLQDGDWRKFTKRGFLLRRSAYLAVGGL